MSRVAMRVHIYPPFEGEDTGDGGVRRVVEAQTKHFPRVGIKLAEAQDADVIASHITMPESYVKNFPDKPLIAHCHGLYWSEYDWEDWSYKANRQVLQAVMTADIATAPSNWVRDVLRRHTSRDVRTVYHGIDLREWQPAAEWQPYVLWNKTRIDPVCDVTPLDDLVAAMPRQDFVSTFGQTASNLHLIGRVSYAQSKEVVRHAGVYLATTRETFGIGTLEAMAAGVPIVGYNFGGQPEIITHGEEGWLVQPGDIDGLAEGVRWALDNREEVGALARERAKAFSWASAAKAYRDVYDDALAMHTHKGPRVTIIVTAYNLAQFLPDTLRSIEAQTDADWECIIVDDASPDDCGKIADEWERKDRRFRVIHNETNTYLAEARNVGIRSSRGRYILPLDADDMLSPRAVATLADALDANRRLSAAYGGVFFVHDDGTSPVDYRVPGQTAGHSGWPSNWSPQRQVEGFNLAPYASMFRKEAWNQVGGYRRRLRTAEDADFWMRFASWGYHVEKVTSEDLLIYRTREGSMSTINEPLRYNYLAWYPWRVNAQTAPAALAGEKAVSLLTPRCAVIIPVGPGHEQYVQTAVDSVAAQSTPFWECIVVNDSGSSLHLPSWVKVVEADVRDTGAARNAGIAAATAPTFLPLDADDFLEPRALEMLLEVHRRTRGEIIYPDFWEDPDKEGTFTRFNLPDWECGHLTTRGCVHSVTALTPVEVWKAVGGYVTGKNWEDWDFQLRCAKAGYCSRRLAVPLFTYRKWTGKRRGYDQEEFERRKAGILEDWADYFEGRKQFMSCGCKGRTVAYRDTGIGSMSSREARAAKSSGADAVLVEYTGNKAGGVSYRGITRAVYSFRAGDPPKWVAAEDVQTFSSMSDFRVIPGGASEEFSESRQPILTA